jgi:cation:H+ antiporter
LIQSLADFASWSGVSSHTIELTLIAFGITLPALATALIAAIKGEEDIATGTILGANIYSLLLAMTTSALIIPPKLINTVFWRDLPVLFSLMALLVFLNMHYKKELTAWHGGILLIIYCSYILSLVLKSI